MSLPKQNRVTPFGDIIATPERGLFMGNRGILHNDQQEIVTPFISKAWIICRLHFKGRKRTIMSPGRYTELFFLDEATALATGHRPCYECQRERAIAFRATWQAANGTQVESRPLKMNEIDAILHTERLIPGRLKKNRTKQTYTAAYETLPNGTFIAIEKRPFLIWNERLYPWTPGAYNEPITISAQEQVIVLTPPSTVGVFAHGYVPTVHESARIS